MMRAFLSSFFSRILAGFFSRMLLLALLLAVGLLAEGDYSGSGPPSGGLLADEPKCDEYLTDYSMGDPKDPSKPGCRVSSDTCGTYCFFANCIKCSDACHEHCREECSDDGEGGQDCEQVCWEERHGVSPCEHWLWHLYGKDLIWEQWKDKSDKPYKKCPHGSGVYYMPGQPEAGPPRYSFEKEFEVPTPRTQPALGFLEPPPIRNKCVGDPPSDPTPQPRYSYDTSHPGITAFTQDIHAGVEPTPTLAGVWETGVVEGMFFIGGMDVRRLTDLEDLGRDLSGHRAANMLPEVSDPGGLAVIPGEPGAPVLQSVSRVLEPPYNEVILSVGSHSGALEYRVWLYNGAVPDEGTVPGEGTVPTEGTVPFVGLPADGRVSVPLPSSHAPFSRPSPYSGVYSFQVRAGAVGTGPGLIPGSTCPPHRLFATPVPADPPLPTLAPLPSNCQARSNVLHQLLGPPSLPTPPAPRPLPGKVPSPVKTPHALPTLEFGSRPVAPSIVSASEVPGSREVPGSKGVVRVNVAPGYSGTLEYRVWTHTGHQPSREDERFVLPGEDDDRWRPAASGNFLVSGLDYPLFWSLQVRAVGVDGVPSEPSNSVSVMVWGGAGVVHSDLRNRISRMIEIPDRGQPLPAPAGGARPDPPSIQAVDEVIGAPGEVEVTMRSYSGGLQLRRWRHTGRLPEDVYEGRTWSWEGVSPDASGKFKLDGLDFPTVWDFQTRLAGSEPSNVVSLMVWGEISPSPTPCAVWESQYPSPPRGALRGASASVHPDPGADGHSRSNPLSRSGLYPGHGGYLRPGVPRGRVGRRLRQRQCAGARRGLLHVHAARGDRGPDRPGVRPGQHDLPAPRLRGLWLRPAHRR